MRLSSLKQALKKAALALTIFVAAGSAASAQTVNITATTQTTMLPDGNTVPMWGWNCVSATAGASCSAMNGGAQLGGTTWQPPLIRVQSGAGTFTINLTNNLPVETSLTIIGQLPGGGLGSPVRESGPRTDGAHAGQSMTTWTNQTPATFLPPAQGLRARSFVPEATALTGTASYTWTALKPGTYLIESGTYPSIQGPMGLYGVLVVTTDTTVSSSTTSFTPAPGTAYPGINYDADIPVLLSEIDPVQNKAAAAAAITPGFDETRLPTSGPLSAITVTNGGSGYTTPPTVNVSTGTGGSNVSAIATLGLVQIAVTAPGTGYASGEVVNLTGGGGTGATAIVDTVDGYGAITGFAVLTEGYGYTSIPTISITSAHGLGGAGTASLGVASVSMLGSGVNFYAAPAITFTSTDGNGSGATAIAGFLSQGCSAAHTCYPPAVNYTPLYYLVNGKSFDNTTAGGAVLTASVPGTASTGNVMVRFVNAGLRIHSPAVNGLNMSLIAEDGNVLPDVALAAANSKPLTVRVQNDVFLTAGKVYDVMVTPANNGVPGTSAPTAFTGATYQIFDRELSLSAGGIKHDSGMQTTLLVGSGTPATPQTAVANPDTYYVSPGVTLSVTDPGKGVIANDIYVAGVQLLGTGPTLGTLTLNPNGTFTYVPGATWTASSSDTFQYYANGNTGIYTTVTLSASTTLGTTPNANAISFPSNIAGFIRVNAPGVLTNDSDPNGYPLTAAFPAGTANVTFNSDGTAMGRFSDGTGNMYVFLMPDGSFTAFRDCGYTIPSTCTAANVSFPHVAINSEKVTSAGSGLVTTVFSAPSNLSVTVQDAGLKTPITDYKWIIEQDLTFKLDPALQVNNGNVPPTLGTNFHTSYMPVIATGCTGMQSCERGQTIIDTHVFQADGVTPNPNYLQHVSAECLGSGICSPSGDPGSILPPSTPDQVSLNALNPDGTPAKYYISVLPGDAANSFNTGNVQAPTASCFVIDPVNPATTATGQQVPACGHTMSGAPINPPVAGAFAPVVINVEPNPIVPATVTAYVFEDDWPLNGEPDAGGGVDTLATQEVPLGDFQIEMWDDEGSAADATGQMTYDMFNNPLTNSLNGTIDPSTGLDSCPISNAAGLPSGSTALVGAILVCPHFESDGQTISPLEGQVVVRNLMPGRFGIIIHPGAAREAAGEEWYQTNTLDGTHYQDSFVRAGEPAYFQEFGPGGYHVFFGMANPKIINARLTAICAAAPTSCTNVVSGQVTNLHESRPPNEQLYSSAVKPSGDPTNYAALAHTTCYAAIGDPDGQTFGLVKCDQNGNFVFPKMPSGNYAITVFDQWVDLIVDGSSKTVNVPQDTANGPINYAAFTWQTHIWNSTYLDLNGNGIQDPGEPGLLQIPSRIRFRNGKINNTLFSDINGLTHFNETFPLFSWYVAETDTTRFKSTGVHVVYDSGGIVDSTGKYAGLINSLEPFQLPSTASSAGPSLRFPGSHYCLVAECTELSGTSGFPAPGGTGGSTGRVDPGTVISEGLQGFLSQTQILDWGKIPYATNETGGIRGHVVYSSTRPFDDPSQQFQNLWEPLIPGVTINLYQEGTAADGTTSLNLIDHTVSSSWDAYAQGFRADGVTPNLNCPGQDPADPYLPYTLSGTRNYLFPGTALPYNSQYKCYDGLRPFNQVQPAPYDGMYLFPSVATINQTTGKVATSNCVVATATSPIGCVSNPTDGTPMLLPGKYVVEVIPPQGYEIVKEEDKNILIGDSYTAPVTQQFGGLANIFIVPDQATINNGNPAFGTGGGATDPTVDLGHTLPSTFGPGGVIVLTVPCVGALHIVPDFMSISPESGQVAPFAGSSKHLCDRREVTLEPAMQGQTDFFLWTKTPASTHYTGFILDDLSSEFNPASPDFGEKFAVPNLPISIRDFNGVETSRVYSDQWGIFNGLTYSTWEVNPPNPTGYAPNMMVTCMNDPGPIPGPNGTMITDPLYNPAYSNFCYENPFMPQDTTYLDTPVIPTSAFAEGYNPPDCAYPDATPAIASVIGDVSAYPGPWVPATGTHTLTITALGDQLVLNHAYSGPAANSAPFNQKFITRHYGFGTFVDPGTSCGSIAPTGSCITIGGVPAPVSAANWTDGTITVTVPSLSSLPPCASSVSKAISNPRSVFGTCGQLVITSGNGKQSIDAITVTVGGKAPTVLAAGATIQSAIDAATPGDLVIIPAGTYTEMLLMWKPIRLQGVGAASVTVNANTHPSGKILEPWRRKINCLFGLSLAGGELGSTPANGGSPIVYDPSSTYTCAPPQQNSVDPVPLEAVIGWDATTNGNLAELLQEPTLMGAYEGSAITILGRSFTAADEAAVSAGTTSAPYPIVDNSAKYCDLKADGTTGTNTYFIANFMCAPSRVDGMTFTNSSQGGGGVFLHGWNHYTEVSNNRVHGNGGTLSGGITVGQPEANEGTLGTNNRIIPYNWNMHVNIHNNSVTFNSSYGDELNSNTPAAAGGVTLCLGSDYYKFNYNWICGNMSTGDGGGMSHYGYSVLDRPGTDNYDPTEGINHNAFLFNQSYNTTISTHGGGLIVQGGPPDGAFCENLAIDFDCPPGLTDGAGYGIVVNANLMQGNTAESGSGGGLRLQNINGNDVPPNTNRPSNWGDVTVTNNIIANNVAGWVGGGVSIWDAINVKFINNTVVSNDNTASAGVLFDTIGAPNANQPPPNCNPDLTTNPNQTGCNNGNVTTSNFEPAGLAMEPNSILLQTAFGSTATCPSASPSCMVPPTLENNFFWQNRSFHITTGPLTPGNQQGIQTVVTLAPSLSQTVTGACPTSGFNGTAGPTYWDLGVYGDTAAGNHASGYTLTPSYSIVDDPGYAPANHNLTPSSSGFISQYCNGSRVPPEAASQVCNGSANAAGCNGGGNTGTTVNPGIPDINPFYPVFSLVPAATTDEGNNFINMFYGPLSLSNMAGTVTKGAVAIPLGNYGITAASPAIAKIPNGTQNYTAAPAQDFFSANRKPSSSIDIGAVKFVQAPIAIATITGGPLAFGNVAVNTTSTSKQLLLSNTGNVPMTGITYTFTTGFARAAAPGNCTNTLAAGSTCTINVVFMPTVISTTAVNGTLTIGTSSATVVTGSPVSLSGTGIGQGTLTFTLVTPAPTGVTFGKVLGIPTLGFGLKTSSTTAVMRVTAGGTAPVIINSATLTNLFGSNMFSIPTGGDTCPIGGTGLAVGSSCTVSITLTPVTPTPTVARTATVIFTDNGTGSPQAFAVSGR
jgi:Bacterial Ig domain